MASVGGRSILGARVVVRPVLGSRVRQMWLWKRCLEPGLVGPGHLAKMMKCLGFIVRNQKAVVPGALHAGVRTHHSQLLGLVWLVEQGSLRPTYAV